MIEGLAIIVAFLSGFTNVKLGDVQSVELVIIGALALSFLMPRQAARIEGPAVTVNLIPLVLVMLALVACGSLLSLRLTLYPPDDVGLFRRPPWATVSRLIEVSLSVSSVFIIALSVRDKPSVFRKILAAYAWAALINAFWGMFCFAFYYISGIELPGITTASYIPRLAGFFNEGGPLGVYMAGAALVQFIRGHILRYISRLEYWVTTFVMAIALIGSQSKAAVLVVILLALFGVIQQRRAGVVVLAVALTLPLAVASNLVEGVNGYYTSLTNFREKAYENSTDGSIVNGRLMASVLLPRIVEAHPVMGIGIGNYGLVRNDPKILDGLPRTEIWDLHGLGLFGYVAELGIPLTLFVLYIYAYPLIKARRQRGWIFVLSAYPVLAALFGVQLNFAYPWVVMGIALAAISIDRSYHLTRQGSVLDRGEMTL